jgi:hypothetical protein
MPRVLRGLHISNVDRTWKGRNGYSKAVLFKAVDLEDHVDPSVDDDNKEPHMTLDMEALDPDVRAHIEGLEAQIKEAAPTDEAIAEAVEKAIGELSAEDLVGKVEGLALAEPETDPGPDIEELVKGLPEALQAEIRKGQEALTKAEKLEAEAEKRHFAEIAKSMPALNEKTDEVADALRLFAKAVGGEDTDQYKLVSRVLKAADAQAAEAMKTLGKAVGHGEDGAVLNDKDEALQQIDQLAADMVTKGLAPTTQQAKLALRETHPALIAKALG